MFNLVNLLMSRLSNEKGQGLVEYVLLIGIIAIAVIAIMGTMGTQLIAEFQGIIDSLIGS